MPAESGIDLRHRPVSHALVHRLGKRIDDALVRKIRHPDQVHEDEVHVGDGAGGGLEDQVVAVLVLNEHGVHTNARFLPKRLGSFYNVPQVISGLFHIEESDLLRRQECRGQDNGEEKERETARLLVTEITV